MTSSEPARSGSVCSLNGILGSARVSRAGDDVFAIANFFDWFFTAEITEITEPEEEC
jgi:hypothetical protein